MSKSSGPSRAKSLSQQRRSEIALTAAVARWYGLPAADAEALRQQVDEPKQFTATQLQNARRISRRKGHNDAIAEVRGETHEAINKARSEADRYRDLYEHARRRLPEDGEVERLHRLVIDALEYVEEAMQHLSMARKSFRAVDRHIAKSLPTDTVKK